MATRSKKILETVRRIEEMCQALLDKEPPPPNPDPDPFDLSRIHVPHPGTPEVFGWPEVVDLDIRPRINGENIILAWPRIDWPDFDILEPEHRYFGHSGIVYRSGARWHGIATEWLRDAKEREGTWYPYAVKFVEGPPDEGQPIALFIAGPWRYMPNRPEYRRRARLKWFTWPELKPFTWPED